MPKIFHWVQFRRIRRQRNDRNVLWDGQIVARVETGLVPNHHDVNLIGNFPRELLQENIDDLDVDIWR